MQGRQQAGLSTGALWPGRVAARCYPEMPRVLISLDSRHPERLLSAVLRRRWSGVASQGSPEPGGSGRPQVRLGVESQLCSVPRCDSCHRRVTGAVCRQEDKQPGTWSASQPGAVLVPRPHLAAQGAEPERGPSPPTSPPREQRRPVRTSRRPARTAVHAHGRGRPLAHLGAQRGGVRACAWRAGPQGPHALCFCPPAVRVQLPHGAERGRPAPAQPHAVSADPPVLSAQKTHRRPCGLLSAPPAPTPSDRPPHRAAERAPARPSARRT